MTIPPVHSQRTTDTLGLGSAPGKLFAFLKNQLGLRDNRSQFAVTARNSGLQDNRRAAAMQGHADGMHGIAPCDGGKKIGLALDRRGGAALGQAHPGGQSPKRIAQGHNGTTMEDTAPVTQLFAHRELGFRTLRRMMEKRYSEQLVERRNRGESHS